MLGCSAPEAPPALDLAAALGGSADGFELVTGPRDLEFPRDHLPHPDYRTEWWYVVGHLEVEGTFPPRRFGYQATVFRTGLAPGAPEDRSSSWATTSLWLAHLALTDVEGAEFRSAERLAREGAGVGGATATSNGRVKLEVDDWRLEVGGEPFGMSVEARVGAAEADDGRPFGMQLDLVAEKPLVLHGDRGFSKKGNTEGAASYYYSATRLAARGVVELDGVALPVVGSGWFDREWSTSLLEGDVVGWDWFAVQLEDGRELMVFELRDSGGQPSYRSGTLIDAAGAARPLGSDEVGIEVLERWTSPLATTYPSRWRLRGPDGLELTLHPLVEDQEHRGRSRYWEGAVEARCGSPSPCGYGYVELVGYAGSSAGARSWR